MLYFGKMTQLVSNIIFFYFTCLNVALNWDLNLLVVIVQFALIFIKSSFAFWDAAAICCDDDDRFQTFVVGERRNKMTQSSCVVAMAVP